jgi:hypothetical protein
MIAASGISYGHAVGPKESSPIAEVLPSLTYRGFMKDFIQPLSYRN